MYSTSMTAAMTTAWSMTFSNFQTGQMIQWGEDDQVGFSVKDALGGHGEFCESKVAVRCPYCAYPNHPFRRKQKPICVETGERWTTLNAKEPYAHYQCFCVYCDNAYVLRLFD